MPSPKSAKPPTPISPVDPAEAYEADTANPGEMEKVKARQRQTGAGKYGQVKVDTHDEEKEKNDPEKKHWIEIELQDKKGKPVPGEPYSITLPNGKITSGTLDQKGLAHVDGIDPGTCKVTFPRLDKSTWKPKG